MSGPTWFDYIGLIASGALVTIEITVVGCAVASVAALLAGLARVSRSKIMRGLARVYIEFFRGTSIFVQLFAAYYLLPLLGFDLSAFAAGTLTLGLNIGAYGAENVRSAVGAVPREQYEACVVLNLGNWASLRRVILPQALPILIPLFGNNAVELLKATSVVSLIALSDMTFQAQLVRFQTGQTFGPFAAILIAYFVLALAIGALSRRIAQSLNYTVALPD